MNTLWKDDRVQFARLITEINATWDLTEFQWDSLLDAMDLKTEEMDELFERAHSAWEKAKAGEKRVGYEVTLERTVKETRKILVEAGSHEEAKALALRQSVGQQEWMTSVRETPKVADSDELPF